MKKFLLGIELAHCITNVVRRRKARTCYNKLWIEHFGLSSGIDGRDTSSGTQFRGARIFARVRPALFAAADLPQALFGHIWDL